MEISRFYGSEKSDTITYLEFGEVNLRAGKKKVWDFRLHQKAYDWLMLGRYTNDIIAYNAMSKLLSDSTLEEISKIHNKEIHHQDETSLSLSKLIALYVSGKSKANTSFFELGQTIFGCIEGMEFCLKLLKSAGIDSLVQDLRGVRWYGLDISEIFNKVSVMLHGDYHVATSDDFISLPDTYDVFFSKGITLLYAVKSIDSLLDIIGKGRCSIFDYSFSMGEEKETTIGSGKTVKYLNIDNFLKSYKNQERVMYIRRDNSYYNSSNNSIFIDCIYANETICNEFITLDTKIRNELRNNFSSEPDILKILNIDKAAVSGWISFEEFIESIAR